MTYGALGQADQIDPVFRRMAQLQPLTSIEESEWGAALASVGRHADARPHHERAIVLDPRNAAAHYRLGLTLQALGDDAAAQTELQNARVLGFAGGTP
jgi:Flp pilus assembly protein TadD